jgi:hypothetical protein
MGEIFFENETKILPGLYNTPLEWGISKISTIPLCLRWALILGTIRSLSVTLLHIGPLLGTL